MEPKKQKHPIKRDNNRPPSPVDPTAMKEIDLKYIIDHLFLPPELPQEHDKDNRRKESVLIEVVEQTATRFATLLPTLIDGAPDYLKVWETVLKMLKSTYLIYTEGYIDRNKLQIALEEMEVNDVLPVFVEAQNAAIIFRKITPDALTFEAFEVTLPSEVVVNTIGKISMLFPTNPRLPFPADSEVLSTLANVLAHLSINSMQEAMPLSKKGGEEHYEIRNTASPRFITEALAGIIRATPPSHPVTVNTTYIHKRLDDHVLWKSALKPWRRSAMWLIIRVAMQSTLEQWEIRGPYGYKAFQAFLMASVVNEAVSANQERFTSDLLTVMNAKVARRLYKLGDIVEDPGFSALEMASGIVLQTANILVAHWREIQQTHENSIQWMPPLIQATESSHYTGFPFPHSRTFLSQLINRHEFPKQVIRQFQPATLEAKLRRSLPSQATPSPVHLPVNHSSTTIAATDLRDIEIWVETHLSKWEQSPARSEHDCLSLASMIDKYRAVASTEYDGKPERVSLMHLCILELWVSLDRICVKWCPLLQEYSPEIVENFGDPLVLPYLSQVKRLGVVQAYLGFRHRIARETGHHSVLLKVNSATSFHNRFFEWPEAHHLIKLEEKIKSEAAHKKAEKVAELQRYNEEYEKLEKQSQAMACNNSNFYSNGKFWQHHSKTQCSKCQLQTTASGLRILPYEDLLPENQSSARPIVFELQCPLPFACWRDATLKILLSVTTVQPKPSPSVYPLSSYQPLSNYFRQPYAGYRIGFASSCKSLLKSHYGKPYRLPAPESQILHRHMGSFGLYDAAVNGWVQAGANDKLRPACTPLIDGTYTILQDFIADTHHSPNLVLASISNCPTSLSTNEYVTFGMLRAGNRLQWRNVMRAIKAHSLSFSESATFALITHTIWQAGPIGEACDGVLAYRQAHIDLLDEGFGRQTTSELRRSIKRLRGNWKQAGFLGLLVILAQRVQSFSPHQCVREDAMRALFEARRMCLEWISAILEPKMSVAEGNFDTEPNDHKSQALANVAVVLRATFDIEERCYATALQSSSDAVTYIYTTVLINGVHSDSLLPIFRTLAHRNHRVSLSIKPYLIEACLKSPSILEALVAKAWPRYSTRRHWQAVPSCHNYWWTTGYLESSSEAYQVLHLNIVDGTFLIDGTALGRLPLDYERHPVYLAVFKHHIFHAVRQSTISDMEYQSHYGDHEVHFSMDGKHLRLLRRVGTSIEEYVPKESIYLDLPVSLCSNYFFWYSRKFRFIKVQQISETWASDNEQGWRIHLEEYVQRSTGQIDRTTAAGKTSLVNPQSSIHSALVNTFVPLEPDSRGLVITILNKDPQLISIHIPRHDLHFSLRCSELECVSLPGYVVDLNLSGIGCLFGLRNVLNLRPSDHRHSGRKILVPKGSVLLAQGQHGHTDVVIHIGASRGYFVYDVDDLVGRLVGSRTMESDLFITMLHAFTTSPIPDPLTRRTGTLEALDRLESAAVFSYHTVSSESRSYLDTLGALTPIRSFYPPHLRVMESIDWHEYLPVYAQHPDFRAKVARILLNWGEMELFLQKGELTKQLDISESFDHLTRRATQRGWDQTSHRILGDCTEDHIYATRDSLMTPESREREQLVFQAAIFTRDIHAGLPICRNLRRVALQWKRITGTQNWEWDHVERWLGFPLAVPIAYTWCTFYELCRRMQSPRFDASVALAFQCFRGVPIELIGTLGAVINNVPALSPSFCCPDFPSLQLAQGSSFDRAAVLRLLHCHKQSFEKSCEYNTPFLPGEDNLARLSRARTLYQMALESEANGLLDEWGNIWPTVPSYSTTRFRLFQPIVAVFKNTLQPMLASWAKNKEFLGHIDLVQSQVNTIGNTQTYLKQYVPHRPPLTNKSRGIEGMTLQHLMLTFTPDSFDTMMTNSPHAPPKQSVNKDKSVSLSPLLDRLDAVSQNTLEKDYLESLKASIDAYEAHVLQYPPHVLPSDINSETLDSLQAASMEYKKVFFDQICWRLRPTTRAVQLMVSTGLWPLITPKILLQSLGRRSRAKITSAWTNHLTSFAISVHDAQRVRRIRQLMRMDASNLLEKEAQYTRAWDPFEYPDWLLVEIDSNISVRPSQATIAEEMLNPDGNRNTVMQLNMGEGKSSVIVPIVAVAVSSGSTLARVIVPRAHMKQQFQILRQCITSLCDRRVIYLPFNRNIVIDVGQAERIQEVLQNAAKDGAVWICEPEHLLSLKMLGLDKSMRVGQQVCSRNLINLHLWLHKNSRDILDESDEILHVRQQVIYTVGLQQAVDSAPLRWETTQKLLGLLVPYLEENSRELSSFLVERVPNKAAFPVVRVQSEAARQHLHWFIKRSIRANDWPIPSHLNDIIAEFITIPNPSTALIEHIRSYCSHEDGSVMQVILILRGLIGCDILLHSLKDRRWRVHYGLDLQRSQLAIPYRAKDSPSPRSEFGHPDVIILLTCLSYYYSGLEPTMITNVLRALISSEAPELTYAEWLGQCQEDVPLSLQSIDGINLQDEEQLRSQLFPLLRYNKMAIDFYLSTLVFPKCAKEFPAKMATSEWDIAIKKPNPTTGFSGTNDGRYLLPVTIRQTDRDAQLHTNAKVLSFILKDKTASVMCYPNFIGSIGLLEKIQALPSKPTVILDVGAQILDLSNLSFVQHWLAMYRDHPIIKAAVFFDESSNLLVITPDGTTQPFIDSPYSSRLDQCLVYLDEAHTRGTDLRIPDTQAVVTLGPKISKDKLVQGCMRMRKLGNGHTVVFMVSDEVAGLVRQATNSLSEEITTEDIILWSIRETWQQLQSNLPAWVLQGRSFLRREDGWNRISEVSCPSYGLVSSLFCEPEAQTLEQLYGASTTLHHSDSQWIYNQHHSALHDTIAAEMAQRCSDFRLKPFKETKVDEEIEIELVHEKEVEREVERGPDAEPAPHVLHPHVEQFVSTGDTRMLQSGAAFRSATMAFQGTSLVVPADFDKVFRNIVVTEDFWRTIQIPSMRSVGSMDNFMRSVNWVVTVPTESMGTLMVLFSPYEVNQLLPKFRASMKVRLHMFTARTNPVVPSLEDLDFLSLPSTPLETKLPRPLAMQLNLFSGSLYFRDYQTYLDACRVLRLHFGPLPSHLEKPDVINAKFFVLDPSARVELGMGDYGFDVNALSFFQNMITMRRFGRGFGPSHMGKILYGTRLKESDFLGDTQVVEVDEDTDMPEE